MPVKLRNEYSSLKNISWLSSTRIMSQFFDKTCPWVRPYTAIVTPPILAVAPLPLNHF